jgi:hypothetical protein
MCQHDGARTDVIQRTRFPTLERVASSDQQWPRVAEKYGVTNPVPPWKTSLDGMCDALDRSPNTLDPVERRREEDLLSHEVYSDLPFPESQLVALAHSLLARGVIEEEILARRMEAVRARLQAGAHPSDAE